MSLGEQFQQPQIPGFDWKKSESDSREALIRGKDSVKGRFPIGSTGMSSLFSNSDAEGKYKDQVARSEPTRSSPTQEVTRLIRLTDIPDNDLLRMQGTGVGAADPASFVSPLVAGAQGQRALISGDVYFNSRSPASEKRGVITHELAHTLQSTLPRSTMEVELHKQRIADASRYADLTDEEASDRLNSAGVSAIGHMSGMARIRDARSVKKRAARIDDGSTRQLESPNFFDSGLPIYEGSAEGYREKYQGSKGSFKTGYTPEYFERLEGQDAAEAFVAAKEHTRRTGSIIPDDQILNATRLAGVLESDLDESGLRQSDHDRSTVHRMMTHILHHANQDQSNPLPSPHEEEFRTRTKAIEGEYVQSSLFPDIAPDVDQFGGSPTGEAPLSPRGAAIRAGQRTEVRPDQTLDAESRRIRAIREERRKNRPLPIDSVTYNDPRASKHRVRLQDHQLDRAQRERANQENKNRVSSSELHPEVEKWLGKLVYQKKADYARSYASARQSGQPIPELPAGLKEEHAEKARASVDKIFKKHGIG